jgi:hypothetical protein
MTTRHTAPTHTFKDPSKIRVDAKALPLGEVVGSIGLGVIELDLQRDVWSLQQKVKFIEWVLLGIPLPSFYFSSDKSGKLTVVDGQKRLFALHQFISGHFALTNGDLEYLPAHILKRPGLSTSPDAVLDAELESKWALRLRRTQLITNTIDHRTPEHAKYDICKRLRF